ncbi:MAG: 50S ribosomal protein L24 [Candidatus Poseidoniaceae archaeon]|jgi:large subunit ribosomal protein L24|nr:50S ribosomal protein L24 [Candidatus Poseidoniaceae archaeon]
MVKSSKPGKQRKAQANAPMHVKRKRVRARVLLDKPDARLAGLRTVTIRVGDTVRVVRGDHAHGGKRVGGKRKADPVTGKVINVDSNSSRVFVEGVTSTKADNREEAVPVHSSNVVIVKLDETDKLRMQQLTAERS